MDSSLYKVFVIVSLLVAALFVHPHFSYGEDENQAIGPLEQLRDMLYENKGKPDTQSKETGVVSIKQKGEDFDIDLKLDVDEISGKKMYFEMQLPQKQMPQEPVKQEDAKPQDAAISKPDVPEQKPEPQKPAEESKQTQPEALKKSSETINPAEDPVNVSMKHILYAQTYMQEGKPERALYEVNRALIAAPNSVVANALKGSIYFKLGDIDLARAFWKKALSIDPTLDNIRASLRKTGGD